MYEPGFFDDWENCGLSIETDLWDLEIAISNNPGIGSVIPASGGVRKLRWKLTGVGKRGGVRVIYMWIPELVIVYMFLVYPKSVVDNLSKAAIARMKSDGNSIRLTLFPNQ